MRIEDIRTDYIVQYVNDGSWWDKRSYCTLEDAEIVLEDAKSDGNGNASRIVLITEIRLTEILK